MVIPILFLFILSPPYKRIPTFQPDHLPAIFFFFFSALPGSKASSSAFQSYCLEPRALNIYFGSIQLKAGVLQGTVAWEWFCLQIPLHKHSDHNETLIVTSKKVVSDGSERHIRFWCAQTNENVVEKPSECHLHTLWCTASDLCSHITNSTNSIL